MYPIAWATACSSLHILLLRGLIKSFITAMLKLNSLIDLFCHCTHYKDVNALAIDLWQWQIHFFYSTHQEQIAMPLYFLPFLLKSFTVSVDD